MKTKKLICIICCLVLVFTLLSGPWRAEAEAAGAATIVLAIVGTFIVSAGFSFATKGEFQSATDAFMKSDAAKYVTEITGYVNDVMALGNANNIYDLAPLITSDWFQAFWQAILDFFGDGEVSYTSESTGYIGEYFHGCAISYDLALSDPLPYSFPCDGSIITLPSGYQVYWSYRKASSAYYLNTLWHSADGNSFSYSTTNGSAYLRNIGEFERFVIVYNESRPNWLCFYGLFDDSLYLDSTLGQESYFAYYNYTGYGFSDTDIYVPGTTPESVIINVNADSSYYNPDIVGSWVTKANEGAIDWALDSSAVYQDVTSADTTSAMTATQTGVLTDAGVAVESISDTMSDYAVPGLASIFPFCIPFDVYNFLSVLTAEREAPRFEFLLDFGNLGSHTVEVDLSGWETVATILRTIELLGFCVGLALATSKLIKW